MTRLLRVELRRLFSRQLVVLTMVGVLAATLLVLWGAWTSSQPMSPAELEQAEQLYQQELAFWEEHGEEQVAQCREAEAEERELTGEDLDFGCDEMEPRREWFVMTAPPLEESMPGHLAGYASLLLLGTLLVGATFTAAELSTGAMSTWLSFEPRRLRVYASKVAAAALGVVPVAVLGVALAVAGAAVIGSHFGLADGMGRAEWADTGWMAVRTVALAVGGALLGAALGFLLRHTAAVLGVSLGYFVGEQMLAALVPRLQPWVLSRNVEGWLRNGTVYWVEECRSDGAGFMCDYVEHTLSFAHSTVFLAVVSAVLVAVAALVFLRRDAI
ncbi:hypothetical protein [uncultured Georgenia sp.]|uniref:hypothetical protein n=1 Tax=uncultured Georgenia sp. TaxID=378209 RepID=UPI00260C96F7|nr:hypothetical protein [uncultured Georgenia sp.]